MERNFFADLATHLAAHLPAHYHSDALAATRAELEKMTAERDLLLRALQGRA